jgi:hypothetical protein
MLLTFNSSSALYILTDFSIVIQLQEGTTSFHVVRGKFYRVSIKSFPDYKHLLQENYMEYKCIFFKCNSTQEVFLQHISTFQQKISFYST